MQKILGPLSKNPYIPCPFAAKRQSLSEIIEKLPPRPKRRNLVGQVSQTPTFGKAKSIKLEDPGKTLNEENRQGLEE